MLVVLNSDCTWCACLYNVKSYICTLAYVYFCDDFLWTVAKLLKYLLIAVQVLVITSWQVWWFWFLLTYFLLLTDGTEPNLHWAREKTVLLRRKPASSVLRMQRRIKTASLYDFAEFCSNKSIRKEFVCTVLKSRHITISSLQYITIYHPSIAISIWLLELM